MSIFGIRKKRDDNDLTVRVNELHRRVQPLVNIERRFTAFQQEININRGVIISQINAHGDRHKALQDRVKDIWNGPS